ncbi:MAG: branched-chain amino acid ABC transporter permease [Pseudorhodoplanes sp.]|nr:MAG: branched-chain amino acid ABC transporter permease [Pseudorhodoplanes sp.]
MTIDIALWLTQDAITNGAVYALLALALVLVYTVTRVIFVPQGEFISFAALSLATLQAGKVPGTVYLLMAGGALVALIDGVAAIRAAQPRRLIGIVILNIGLPAAVAGAASLAALRPDNLWLQMLVTLAIVTPFGPIIYRLAFQPLAGMSVLVLLIIAVAVHYLLTGLGLVFFGGEGLRSPPLSDFSLHVGVLNITAQSLWVIFSSIVLIFTLWLLFEHTLYGKALRATAINRVGARLVGISAAFAGSLSFTLAALIGAIAGILISPITTIYYDTGFIISLKGFVGAIIGGMVSYPVAAAGALLVGFLESFSSFWWSAFKESIVFTLIIPVLLWRSLTARHVDEEEE